MKWSILLFFLISFAVCSFTGTTTDKIQNDLQLDLVYESNKSADGSGIILINLINNSTTEKYKVILPGDGCENAWREPYVYFTGEFRKNKSDTWDTLVYHKPLRCGNYDPDWQEDTLVIFPKQTVQIYQSFFRVGNFFMIESKGTLHMRAHYDYARGEHSRRKDDTLTNGIQGIPGFVLTSDTVHIQITQKPRD